MENLEKLSELHKKRVSRRNFLAGAGALGAATALAGCSDSGTVSTTSTAVTDADLLNFALNLEYLEAEFYLRAATGAGLTSDLIGTSPGTVTGGAKITGLTTFQQNIVNEIAYDEQQHVKLLRSALGSAAVARPAIDLSASFNTLASVAGIASTFNPFADFNSFLVGAFIFEDVGVTAYTGAAQSLSAAALVATATTPALLTVAAGIQAVEAYHAAYVRTALTAQATTLGSTAYPYLGYANKVAALRATLGGGAETMLTIPTAGTATTNATATAVVAADSNALAYGRTYSQVLHIVYGSLGGSTSSAGVKSGVFFPNGLNGNLSTTIA